MNKTKQYIFDTNYYRTLAYNKTRDEIKEIFESQKEKEKDITILFPNIVAIELINHLNDNNNTAKECFNALFGLAYHAGEFENEKVKGNLASTFHCIISNHLFNTKSNFYDLNNNLLLNSYLITYKKEKFEKSIIRNKQKIIQIINYKKNELNYIIKSIENDYLSKYTNKKENVWEIVKDKNFKDDFNKKLNDKTFHNLIANSLIRMGIKVVDKGIKKDFSYNKFITDFVLSIDFYVTHIWKKIIEVEKIEYLINPESDKKRRWNSFYDMQLIMATEFENSLGRETIFVTNENRIIEQFSKFDKKKYVMSVDDYNKTINNYG